MKESNIFQERQEEQKKYQEYITPNKLREFLSFEVGDVKDKIIFDPCVGSGQLLFNIEAKEKIGVEIQEKAAKLARENNIKVFNQDYIFFDDSQIKYDVVITNYPFSLKPSKEQKKYLESQKEYKKFMGKLDRVFIKKSFQNAKKGFYLSFPGILYRREELEFRKWLIENNYLEGVYFLNNLDFENTNIAISLLILNKEKKNEKIKLKTFDNYQEVQSEEKTNQDFINNNFTISISPLETKKEEIDIKKFNRELYQKEKDNYFNFIFKETEIKEMLNETPFPLVGFPNREEIIKDINERLRLLACLPKSEKIDLPENLYN